jgi:hypothetical protein
MKRWSAWFAAACGLAVVCVADPVTELDYQGKVLVNDLPHQGNGYFKFAISDGGSTTNYWANDGTTAGEPSAHLTNSVFNGVFSTILGGSPMTAINSGIFNNGTALYLRVWFSATNSGFAEMLPSQKIVSAPYAVNAGLLGGSSASAIQSNAVSTATNAITMAGDVTGAPHNNQIAAGVIVDADVSGSAAIQGSKVQGTSTTNAGVAVLATGATGTAVIATGHPYLNAFSTVNSISAGTPNSGFGIIGSNNVSVSVAGTNIVISAPYLPALDNVIWVATNGTPAGPGTIERPYDTPQAGYDAAAARYEGAPSVVILAAGAYGSGLVMSSGTVHVLGLHRAEIDSLSVVAPASSVIGYQNVEGVVVAAGTTLASPGARVRFHNCRLEGGTVIAAHFVVFQDCRLTGPNDGGAALHISPGAGAFAGSIGVYQSSLENNDAAIGAIEIGFAGMAQPLLQGLEVIGCEIVNREGATGPAIRDLTPHQFTTFPIKLFAHNYIKGPPPAPGPAYGPPAIADPAVIFPFPGGAGAFIGLYNNTIYGHVGSVVGGVAHPQWHANNTVYGLITFPGAPSVIGWLQAGAGVGVDASGNIQHEVTYPPTMPDIWDD